MAKKGVKVKDLAEDLGVSARAIVSRCRAEGLPVQNRITRLKPDLERTIRAWFGGEGRSTSDGRDPPP